MLAGDAVCSTVPGGAVVAGGAMSLSWAEERGGRGSGSAESGVQPRLADGLLCLVAHGELIDLNEDEYEVVKVRELLVLQALLIYFVGGSVSVFQKDI